MKSKSTLSLFEARTIIEMKISGQFRGNVSGGTTNNSETRPGATTRQG